MKMFLGGVALLFSVAANAQYKCVVNGKSVYADQPCAINAQSVAAPQDRVTTSQRMQAEEVRRREAAMKRSIEIDAAVDQRSQRVAAARHNARLAETQRRCESRRVALIDNARAQARYTDWDWKNSKAQRVAEAEVMQAAYKRDCQIAQ